MSEEELQSYKATNQSLLPSENRTFLGIESSPKSLVLLIISPEYLVIFAYFVLFWQLLSLYFDGHANLFHSVFQGKGKFMISFLGIALLVIQTTLIILYLNELIEASWFTIELIILNFAAPLVVLVIMLSICLKFSGSPIRSSVYCQKIKLLQIAVFVWSMARFIRGACGLFESKLFFGMILGLSNKE